MKKIILFILMFCCHPGTAQVITTIAGKDTAGFNGDSIAAAAAMLNKPTWVAFGKSGNIYISDFINYRIRKINTSGIITTIAGDGTAGYFGNGGLATASKIAAPYGIAVDNDENIYFSDQGCMIRKISTSGIISTIAGTAPVGYSGDGGPATAALLSHPYGIALDTSGNIYFADSDNKRIRKINTSGIITTIAGNGTAGYTGDGGPATDAELTRPIGVAIDLAGNLFFTDPGRNRVCRINAESNTLTTIAGYPGATAGYSGDGGPATDAQLSAPGGITVDNSGNVYFADAANNRIRKVSPSGIITTVAGTGTAGYSGDGGLAGLAELNSPDNVACDIHGNLCISDCFNSRIRFISGTLSINFLNNFGEDIQTYPNPANGQFTIIVHSDLNGQVQVIITNLAGQHVKEITIPANKPSEIQLNQPRGIYLVSVITEHGILKSQLEIQ